MRVAVDADDDGKTAQHQGGTRSPPALIFGAQGKQYFAKSRN